MFTNPRVRNFFAGGNTAIGFYSLFSHIQAERDGRLVVLKGGPGTGKSTLLRNLGKRIQDKGVDVEYFYCSSDSTSLDGVASPSLNFALVDGTLPHAVDLKLPGVYDEIINLGEFWDEKKLLPYRRELEALDQAISEFFSAAYWYLSEASQVLEHMESLKGGIVDSEKNNKEINALLERIIDDDPPGAVGMERHLFGSAITPEGLVNHFESIFSSCRELYLLEGSLGGSAGRYLKGIYQILQRKGLDLEVYRCALEPESIDALVIPEKGIALCKKTDFQPFHVDRIPDILHEERVPLDQYATVMSSWKEGLLRDFEERFVSLLQKSIGCIKKAKEGQLNREPYYSQAMDFSRVKMVEEQLAKKFLA